LTDLTYEKPKRRLVVKSQRYGISKHSSVELDGVDISSLVNRVSLTMDPSGIAQVELGIIPEVIEVDVAAEVDVTRKVLLKVPA
jgi:hypothetical protein